MTVFYSRFKFRFSLLYRSFSTWEKLIIWQPLVVSGALPISQKLSVFGVFLACIFPYSDWIQRENTDQKNSKYWNFSRSDHELLLKNLHLSFEVSIKSTHEFEWYLQSVLLKWTGRTRKMIKRFSVLVVLYLKLLGQFQACLLFFVRKHFARTKTRHKQKPTSKTKLSKQKTTEATIFRAQKNF